MATASSPKASVMVFPRPMWSEIHHQIGRPIPLITPLAMGSQLGRRYQALEWLPWSS
jgi:hypothetical protein